jgi:hypothetical protein
MSESLVVSLDTELSVDNAFRELRPEEIELVGGGRWFIGLWNVVEWVLEKIFGGDGAPPAGSGPVYYDGNGDAIVICGCGGSGGSGGGGG